MVLLMADVQTAEHLGEEWIQAILDQDFKLLTEICHPDVMSSLMVPSRIYQLDNATDLSKKVQDWFGKHDTIDKAHTRIALVGEKLGIFYRLRCRESGTASTIEQQLYCTIRDDRIQQLRLICSGFQPDRVPMEAPMAGGLNAAPINMAPSLLPTPRAHALLEFKANEGQGPTCAMLTPYIKNKLMELSSGQVLEVHVDEITAKEDIEAWSRLSGNMLLKMDQRDDQELVFFISKK